MADPLLSAVGLTALGAVLAGSLLPDTSAVAMPHALVWHVAHAPVYTLLMVLAATFLRHEPNGLLASALVVSLIGMAVEIGQPFLGRTASFVDYLSNEVGVGLGAMTVQWRRRAANRTGEESEG